MTLIELWRWIRQDCNGHSYAASLSIVIWAHLVGLLSITLHSAFFSALQMQPALLCVYNPPKMPMSLLPNLPIKFWLHQGFAEVPTNTFHLIQVLRLLLCLHPEPVMKSRWDHTELTTSLRWTEWWDKAVSPLKVIPISKFYLQAVLSTRATNSVSLSGNIQLGWCSWREPELGI